MIAAEKFSDAYLKFTRVLNQFEVREEDHTIRVPEKVIRYIWNDQLFCTPIRLIFARASKLGDLEEQLNHIFQITKGASDNKLIRFIKYYIFGDEKELFRLPTSVKQVQRLMQFYQDFCTQSQNNCLQCPFPKCDWQVFSLKKH